MPARVMSRPTAQDYVPYYARYIDRVPAGDLVEIMQNQIDELGSLLQQVPEARAGFTYAPGKWTLREVIGHLTDTERVFSYRATAFSRGDYSPLPSYDQDAWNPHGRYDERTLPDVYQEWVAARRASVALVAAMPEAALGNRGIASGFEFSVLALLTVLPGHVIHHVDQLAERYLEAPSLDGR